MNYTDKLNKVVVKTTSKGIDGSGIIFLPHQQSAYLYILTAKHCIYGDKFENNAISTDVNIEYLYIDGQSWATYTLQATDKILSFSTNEPDIAILVIPTANIVAKIGDIPCIKLSPLDLQENTCFFKGYPRATQNKEARTIDNCTILHSDSNNTIIHCNTSQILDDGVHLSTKEAVQGFSGSGICLHTTDDIYLLGIVCQIEDWNNRFMCVNSLVIAELLKDVNLIFETPRNNKFKQLIKNASNGLSKLPNYFGDYKDSHIKRDETTTIFNWILQELPERQRNIAILVGNGGLGKTIVLKDLYDMLEGNISTLAIKADRYTATHRVELEHKLFQQTNVTIEAIFDSLTQNRRKVVLIIDQLDALSQSLSLNRDFLTTYNRLIETLAQKPNIRIVVSIRKYDLEYDAELSEYKKNEYKKIDVALLRADAVKQFLYKIDIISPSEKLVELLRIPNHLNVFCKINDKGKANIDAILSLKDLYDALWKDIMKNRTNAKLLLYEIAKKINERQDGLFLPKYATDDYNDELNYLQSKTIVIENDKGVSFFHQTFYDYVFSKQFVDSKQVLPQYIIENNQSLYVRAVVKMVLEYLREQDFRAYLHTIQQLITDEKYRFHIKYLVIVNIGLTQVPSDKEKTFVATHILQNPKYTKIFLAAATNTAWFKFFIHKNIINEYLTDTTCSEQEKETKINLIWQLLRINTQDNIQLVTDCLEKMPEFPHKDAMVANLLAVTKNWSDKRLFRLFEQHYYNPTIQPNRKNHTIYNILESIAAYDIEYALHVFKELLTETFERDYNYAKLEYDEEQLLNKFTHSYPKQTFEMLFSKMEEIANIDITIKGTYRRFDTPLHVGNYFSDSGFDVSLHPNPDRKIFTKLEAYIRDAASNDKTYFIDFFHKYKNHNATPILKLVFAGLTAMPTYISEFLEIIEIVYAKNAFQGYDDRFSLYLRNLIVAYFPHLPPDAKKRIVSILLKIKSIEDYHFYEQEGKKRLYLGHFGKKQYMFIKALPMDEIENNLLLKKRYQELYRKFGKIEKEVLHESTFRMSGMVAPLPPKAYQKMSIEQWEKSMLKYDTKYEIERWNDKGGIREHATQFENDVKANPSQFKDFVAQIIREKHVALTYRVSGLDGLVAGKHNPQEVLHLFKILIKDDVANFTWQLLRKIEYFTENHLIDQEIIDILVDFALHHENPSKPINPDNPKFDVTQTVRSVAITKLIMCFNYRGFKDIIIDTVEKAANDPQPSVRVAILIHLAYLNHLDIERAFKIFLKLVVTDEIKVLECSIAPASYFIRKYFEKMQGYLIKMIKLDAFHFEVAKLVFYGLYNNINGTEELLALFIEKSSNGRMAILHEAEENLLEDSQINQKCLGLFERFLSSDDKELAHAYATLILRKFKIQHFKIMYAFLQRYAASKMCVWHPRYFLEYLITCSKIYPEQCLLLFELIDFQEQPSMRSNNYYGKEPLAAVLAIYSALHTQEDKNIALIEKTLTLFDNMLNIDHLRSHAIQALDTLLEQ